MWSEIILTLFTICLNDQIAAVPSFYPACQQIPTSICSKGPEEIRRTKSLRGKPVAKADVGDLEMKQWIYNSTVYPSFADDKSGVDAVSKLNRLYPLVSTKCSAFIKLFLCSVHTPVCTTQGIVPPCRELCERVRNDCNRMAQMFNLDWPEISNCEVFPRFNPKFDCSDNAARDDLSSNDFENILVNRITPITWGEVLLANGNVCIPPSDDDEDVISTALARIKSCEQTTSDDNLNLELDFGVACPVNMKAPPDHYGYTFMGLPNCSAPCPNMYLNTQELWTVRYLILVVAIICTLVTAFSLLTSLIDKNRFRYPERPIVFYAFSYLVVSIVFLLGFGLGESAACHPKIIDENNEVIQGHAVVEGSGHRLCSVIFFVLYYFTVSGAIWWLILTITWLLAAGFSWGSEAIEERHLYYHSAAWGLPALQTLLVFIFNNFEGDNIAGLCFVGVHNSKALHFFVLMPMCTYLITGVINLFLGFFYLNRVRKKLTGDEKNQQKLSKFMLRIGVFSVLYFIPQVALIIIYVVEDGQRKYWEAAWYAETCVENGVPCPVKDHPVGMLAQDLQKPGIFIFCIKYMMTLIVALPPLFWVANRKTLKSWREILTRKKSLKLNTTETRLLNDCDDGPHAKDRQAKLKEKFEKKDAVFGVMRGTDHRGSSASVAAQIATKRTTPKFPQPWVDTTDSDSSTYYSTTSMDSEMSRLLELESRQNRGVRITGRKGGAKILPQLTKKVVPTKDIERRELKSTTANTKRRADVYPNADTVPYSNESKLHHNTKLPDPDLIKTVEKQVESSRTDKVLIPNSFDATNISDGSFAPTTNRAPNVSSRESTSESRNTQPRATPSTSISSSHYSANKKRPSTKPPPPPPPRFDSAVSSDRLERTLSI